jgi:hypothetical protein
VTGTDTIRCGSGAIWARIVSFVHLGAILLGCCDDVRPDHRLRPIATPAKTVPLGSASTDVITEEADHPAYSGTL